MDPRPRIPGTDATSILDLSVQRSSTSRHELVIRLDLRHLEESGELGRALIAGLPGSGLLVVDVKMRILLIGAAQAGSPLNSKFFGRAAFDLVQALRFVRRYRCYERGSLMDSRRPWSHLLHGRPSLSGRVRATLIGGLIVVIGVTGSIFLASAWRSSSLRANKKSFQSTAADLSATLDSKLDTKSQLTRAMRSIATMEPNAGDARFLPVVPAAAARRRPLARCDGRPDPAGPRSPPARVPRQAEADPAFRALLGGTFQIVPPGSRPLYCLTRAIVGSPARRACIRRCSTTARR